MALEKGTEEWMFWSDFFQFCKKYWDVRGDEEYWDDLSSSASRLYDIYKTDYSRYFLKAFLDLQNSKLSQ